MRRTSLLFTLAALTCALFLLVACDTAQQAEEAPVALTADQLKIFGTLAEEATPTNYEMSDELIGRYGRHLDGDFFRLRCVRASGKHKQCACERSH